MERKKPSHGGRHRVQRVAAPSGSESPFTSAFGAPAANNEQGLVQIALREPPIAATVADVAGLERQMRRRKAAEGRLKEILSKSRRLDVPNLKIVRTLGVELLPPLDILRETSIFQEKPVPKSDPISQETPRRPTVQECRTAEYDLRRLLSKSRGLDLTDPNVLDAIASSLLTPLDILRQTRLYTEMARTLFPPPPNR